MKKFIGYILNVIGNLLGLERIRLKLAETSNDVSAIRSILIDEYLQKNLFENPKYSNSKKLNKYEYQITSQNGEDGIIAEIFNRIGTTNKNFVEFGVEKGLENNTLSLLLNGWDGYWLEGSPDYVQAIKEKFHFLVEQKRLCVEQAFINAENIESLFEKMSVPKEFDLLSIDIDGNDYWVWKAINNYSPRVVVIEYNAVFRPPQQYVVKYQPEKHFPITSYFGASLESLKILGEEKGYKLVGCNFLGVNAFFVRKDLVADKFLEPFTAEVHYEPPRYQLTKRIGHVRNFGEFIEDSED